jgi:hypothetical protein
MDILAKDCTLIFSPATRRSQMAPRNSSAWPLGMDYLQGPPSLEYPSRPPRSRSRSGALCYCR